MHITDRRGKIQRTLLRGDKECIDIVERRVRFSGQFCEESKIQRTLLRGY